MLNEKPMKLLYLVSLIIFGFTTNAGTKNLSPQAPVANAGPDQKIYLTQTSAVTLNGSGSSGDSYQWTKIYDVYPDQATPPTNPSTIVSPNSATTSVTGLVQGNWYYQLAVTSGGITKKDTVIVRVDYDAPPANSTIYKWLDMPGIAPIANKRDNISSYFSISNQTYSQAYTSGQSYYLYRDNNSEMMVDSSRGKFYSIAMDGVAGGTGNFARIEVQDRQSDVDTSHINVWEWRGYLNYDLAKIKYAYQGYEGVFIFQLHGTVGSISDGPPLALVYYHDSIAIQENFKHFDLGSNGGNGSNGTPANPTGMYYKALFPTSILHNQSHTIRFIVKEGVGGVGQSAFVRIELDGKTVYYRNNGQVGESLDDQTDYMKYGSIYDYGKNFIDPANTTRGRKLCVVTEKYTWYRLSDNPQPNADAGKDQVITLPTNSVNLSGSGSVSGGSIKSYNWTKSSGPSGETITSPNSQSTSVTNLVQGTYIFQLKVTDNNGATATSTVQITVNPSIENSLPKAAAGADQTITLPINSVYLKGSGFDSDGTITAYLWSKTNGPSGGIITSSSSDSTGISNLQQGEYTFQLKVTDNSGGIGTDTVHVSVKAAVNQSPIADAGANQNIVLPTSSVNLSGKGIDSDGSVTSYQWTKISGNSCVITNADSSNTTINGLTEGSYAFQLIITDNQGATGKDTVLVSVKAAVNIIPAAFAGEDKTITLPTNSVTLSGSGNDSDGTIASYLWTKISGPAATITTASSAATNVTGLLQGTYQFELKVTDDKGAIGKDTVQVKVDSASNISIPAQGNVAPTANAGKDQTITLPTNSVTLSGSGNDSDGTIVSYFWTKISGPSSFVISNAGLSSTGVTGLIEGTYQFELKVTDDKGAIGKDTVQIKVNQAVISTPETGNVLPVVNAGADITITLPTNSTILSGTASDSDGTIASYSWTKISGPASFSLINSSSATANVTGLVAGTYQFELKVTDDKGGARKDSVQVIVLNGTNTSPTLQENSAPTANAGGDQTITLPTNSITLSGSGTDTDGTIASYSWTKISGPASFSVVASSSAATDITGLIEGIYQFELRVTDDKGAIGKDTVQIKVDSAINDTPVKGNIAPTADAGSDITTVSSTKFITLSGSGNDSDGKIISYLWTQISGPSGTVISASNAPTTKVRNLQEGTYEFELKVTDDQGAVATDTVKVTVALERTSTDNVTVKSTSLKVYPNPVHDVTTLEVTAPRINTNIMIVISNINGKTVYTKEFVSNSTYVTQQIDMSNLIKGSYIISVYFDGMQQQSIKVMKL